MNRRKISSIEIYNNKFYLGAVMNFLDAIVANHTSHDFGRYNRLRYVVGELLKRRIENAYPGAQGMIVFEIYLTDEYVEVSIKDKGVPVWTDFAYDKEHIDTSNEETMQNFLMDFMVDGFGIEKLGKDGQRIYVRMNILHKIAFKKPEPYPDIEVLDTNITIKPVETYEDAIEAIRCIYSEYGYSYSYEKLYYIDSFMAAIKNKEIMSFLAVNEHGQTAGHFALAFSDTFRNMPEISTVVTRKEFRGLGLFAKFMDYSMELGRKHGFRALMGQPVAFHPFSQKAFLRAEFTATSVLLAYIDSAIESEYNPNKQRLDLFASVKMLDSSAHSTLYPPKEIRAFTDGIFAKLGCSYELRDDEKLSDSTAVNIETSSRMKSTKILLMSAAEDLEHILLDAVKDSLKGHNEMIEIFISMNDPSCGYAYRTAQKCGFSFSGLLPGSEKADYIVMQILVGSDCSYDHLVTVGEFEEIRKDIIRLNR